MFSNVTHEPALLFEVTMPSPSRKENEHAPEPKVLKICKPSSFAPGARRLSGTDCVFFDDPLIDSAEIFLLGDNARDVEEVRAADVAASVHTR
jgi:hypothetical protein